MVSRPVLVCGDCRRRRSRTGFWSPFLGVAVLFRAVLGASGILLGIAPGQLQSQAFLSFLALRWLAGLIGLAVLAWMSWQTLKIPNTQSATGILYVAVIFAFLGELTSQLLSAQTPFPL